MRSGAAAYDLCIVGGGLAGLSMAILACEAGHSVLLIEKETYPRHKVCGEYISNESKPFLRSLGVKLDDLQLPQIDRFRLTTQFGQLGECALEPGGTGISRYMLDALLAERAKSLGATVLEGKKADRWSGNETTGYKVHAGGNVYESHLFLSAWGRAGGQIESREAQSGKQWVGVKYHVDQGPESDVIEIHQFPGGYAGISEVEDGRYCLCYLVEASHLKAVKGDISRLESQVLGRNPALGQRLKAKKLFDPLTTSQFAFKAKAMTPEVRMGDAQGFIPPLTGNGMSLALRSSHELFPSVDAFLKGELSWSVFERTRNEYIGYLKRRIRCGVVLQDLLLVRPQWLNRTFMEVFTNSSFMLRRMTRLAVGETIPA